MINIEKHCKTNSRFSFINVMKKEDIDSVIIIIIVNDEHFIHSVLYLNINYSANAVTFY